MTIELWPRDGVHFAAVDGDIIVLDVQADQYGCLYQAGAWISLRQDGAIIVADDPSASELMASGLACSQRPSQARRSPTPAQRERASAPGGDPIRIVGVALTLVSATLTFRARRFRDLVEAAGRGPACTKADRAPALAPILAAYGAALPWIPLEGECLQRACLLHQLLKRCGVAADWVFGVRTWPFAAHCWLQIGDEIIGDSLARVKLYTPILVV